tara:strand:+ start:7571 stop:8797 length:1227 start_codon:yes stop_codon:yes gene_type:complete
MKYQKLTIALPTSTFLPSIGGVEVGLHNIALNLSRSGHQPVVIAPATHIYQLRKLHLPLPYKLVALPPKTLTLANILPDIAIVILSNYFSLLQKRHNFDIWHGTVGYPVGVALARFGLNKFPHLIRCAGDDIQIDRKINYGMRINPRIDALVQKWLPQADAMVAITESIEREYENIGVPKAKILRIPNGVSLERFTKTQPSASLRKKYDLPQNAFLFLTVGRNHPKKGFKDLIRASSLLNATTSRPFAVAIAGADTHSLTNLISQEGLTGKIFCLGEIGSSAQNVRHTNWPSEDLVDLYKTADAFVFPSHIESFGIALVEAMAAGLPVITTDGPGCVDVVGNGAFGKLVPVGNPSSLAKAMQGFQEEKALREQYISASQRRAKDFSWETVVAKYLTAYQTLITNSQTV